MEIGGKSQHGNIWCISYRFSLIFFANYNLFSLRNMPTKFREVTPSGCEVVWKLVENLSMGISGAFLIGFLWFFLLNKIYLAYEICLQSFARLRPAVVKLYGNWWKFSTWKFLVHFLLVFFDFFLLITIYLAYETCLRRFARLRPAVVKLCGNWWKMSV